MSRKTCFQLYIKINITKNLNFQKIKVPYQKLRKKHSLVYYTARWFVVIIVFRNQPVLVSNV